MIVIWFFCYLLLDLEGRDIYTAFVDAVTVYYYSENILLRF